MKKLTVEQEQALKELVAHNRKQIEAVDGEQNKAVGVIDLPYEEYAIYDVFYDESIRNKVNPVEYYGYDKIIEMLNKWENIKVK